MSPLTTGGGQPMPLQVFKERLGYGVLFLSISACVWILGSENIVEQFVPRAICMLQNPKMITLHGLSDGIIFLSYTAISIALFKIYNAFRTKAIPFKGFLWMYAGFIFLCGLTHAMGVVNLWVTFYWLDGLAKLLTAWFSAAVAISFVRATKYIKDLKTPDEYEKLAKELAEIRAQLNEVHKNGNGTTSDQS